MIATAPPRERALLVGVQSDVEPRYRALESLEELAALTESAGALVVDRDLQHLRHRSASTLLGKGKVEAIKQAVAEHHVAVVIVDDELSPTQQRNLETAWSTKVVDRTGLILDIFAQRARTQEGKLQVELAQLTYMLPRLVGGDRALSRLGGGIGTRGPGERKLEVRRRVVKDRIAWLHDELDRVRQRRGLQRRHRSDVPLPALGLVGYTNAGKSSLFNALSERHGLQSDARAHVADQLFATLDPMTRALRLPSGRVVLVTDTVGFIRKLPHQLVEAFRSTLEELNEADVLLHVVDVSHEEWSEQAQAVGRVLEEIGATDRPILTIHNKIDLLAEPWGRREGDAVALSALTGAGLDDLVRAIEARLDRDLIRAILRLPKDGGRLLSTLYAGGHVLTTDYQHGSVEVEVMLHRKHLDILRTTAGVEIVSPC